MFEQDYIMRLIQQLVQVIVKILFNIDTESPSSALIQNSVSQKTADDLLRKIDSGNINESVNELSKLIENKTTDNLLIGIVFYSYLNEKDDDYLEINDFSRSKVKNGIENLLSEYGLDTFADIFSSTGKIIMNTRI